MDFTKLMQQAQEMQNRVAQLQQKVGDLEATGSAGAGMVTVTMTGKGAVRTVHIDRALIVPEEASILEDLVAAAVNDAKTRVDALVQQETQRLMSEFKLPPGFTLPT